VADDLRAALDDLLAPHGLHAEPVGDDPSAVAVLDAQGSAGAWPMAVVFGDDDEAVVVYAHSPYDVVEDRIDAVAELCHRANLGLFEGCLEFDFDEGEVRIRAGSTVAGQPPGPLLERLLRVVADLAETYGPALEAVAEGADPAAAIAEVEGIED
jgi:hypothetical protein